MSVLKRKHQESISLNQKKKKKKAQCTIDLPDELIEIVFEFIGYDKFVLDLFLVCSRWCRICSRLTHETGRMTYIFDALEMEYCYEVKMYETTLNSYNSAKKLKIDGNITNTEYGYTVDRRWVSNMEIFMEKKCPDIEYLILCDTHIYIKSIHKLKSLTLYESEININGEALGNIERLSFDFYSFLKSNRAIKVIVAFNSLKEMIVHCDNEYREMSKNYEIFEQFCDFMTFLVSSINNTHITTIKLDSQYLIEIITISCGRGDADVYFWRKDMSRKLCDQLEFDLAKIKSSPKIKYFNRIAIDNKVFETEKKMKLMEREISDISSLTNKF